MAAKLLQNYLNNLGSNNMNKLIKIGFYQGIRNWVNPTTLLSSGLGGLGGYLTAPKDYKIPGTILGGLAGIGAGKAFSDYMTNKRKDDFIKTIPYRCLSLARYGYDVGPSKIITEIFSKIKGEPSFADLEDYVWKERSEEELLKILEYVKVHGELPEYIK